MATDDSSFAQENPGAAGHEGPGSGPGGPWVPDLASLTRTGQISERVLANVKWNRVGDQVGSWLDPLFEGPAPIAELQGLGDRYVQLQFIGEGAAGTVFKALDTLLQRWVALKMLKTGSNQALSEARAQAQVEHPNVCRVYEVGQGFIIMQLVEGPTLATLTPAPDLRTKISYLRDIAFGVHAAHQRGLFHLDLKLNNILMQDNGDGTLTPILTDFGMVLKSSGEWPDSCPLGTPPFSSPEQLAGDFARIGPATDVYALGVMAYVLLSGQSPFQATSVEELLSAMAVADPIPIERALPGIPRDLARLIHRCLSKDPALRCRNPGELALELDRFLHSRPLEVMGGALTYRALRCAQRNRFTSWAVLLGTVALGIALVLGGWREARTAQRTEWDHHFQKQVEQARVIMERAYRQPLHDIRPEIARVKAIEEAVGSEMKRHGRLLDGPGHLALGQLAAVSDAGSEEAARHFNAAWNAGFHTERTRTWLAFSYLREYRGALATPRWKQRPDAEITPEALRREYLEPARQMLRGRGDTDQEKLTYMLDQVEIHLAGKSHRTMVTDLLDLAVAYRLRSPQDLDAILEEVNARFLQVRSELDKEDASGAGAEAEVLAHWHSFLSLLEEARAAAPSHPGLCAAQASAAELALDYPFLEKVPPHKRMEHLKACLGQALLVSPDNSRLLELRINSLVRETLDEGLPMDRFKAEVGNILGDPQKSAAFPLVAFLSLTPSGAWRGIDLVPFTLEVLASQGGVEKRPEAWVQPFLLAHFCVLQGRDPQPAIRACAQGFKARYPWRLFMVEAEHLIQCGRASEIDLSTLDAAFAQEFAMAKASSRDRLLVARVRALARGSSADWKELEHTFLQVPELVSAWRRSNLDDLIWYKCGQLLAEHTGGEGRDPGGYLASLAHAMDDMRGAGLEDQTRRDLLGAQTWLVRDRIGLGSPAGLAGALTGLNRTLRLFPGGIPFKDLGQFGISFPGRGPILALRGELGFHQARSLRGRARMAVARKAALDLDEAIRLCPDYLPRLAPLREEVRRLAQA